MEPMLCLHCGDNPVSLSYRGLCMTCYRLPSIRRDYPLLDQDWDKNGYRLPQYRSKGEGEPTSALPGSEAKIQVLEERVRRGVELFHPLDEGWKSILE